MSCNSKLMHQNGHRWTADEYCTITGVLHLMGFVYFHEYSILFPALSVCWHLLGSVLVCSVMLATTTMTYIFSAFSFYLLFRASGVEVETERTHKISISRESIICDEPQQEQNFISSFSDVGNWELKFVIEILSRNWYGAPPVIKKALLFSIFHCFQCSLLLPVKSNVKLEANPWDKILAISQPFPKSSLENFLLS